MVMVVVVAFVTNAFGARMMAYSSQNIAMHGTTQCGRFLVNNSVRMDSVCSRLVCNSPCDVSPGEVVCRHALLTVLTPRHVAVCLCALSSVGASARAPRLLNPPYYLGNHTTSSKFGWTKKVTLLS